MLRSLIAIAVIMLATTACGRGGRASERDSRCTGASNAAGVPHPFAYAFPVPGSDHAAVEKAEKECIRPGTVWSSSDELFYCCRTP